MKTATNTRWAERESERSRRNREQQSPHPLKGAFQDHWESAEAKGKMPQDQVAGRSLHPC